MRYYVIIIDECTGISTYDNTIVSLNVMNNNKIIVDLTYQARILRKTGNIIESIPVHDIDLLHYFTIETTEDTVIMKIYQALFDDILLFKEVYHCSATKGKIGIVESEDGMLSFWHEFFAQNMMSKDAKYNEKYVNHFSMIDNPMMEIHKIFPVYMQENPFLFFENYQKQKKLYKDFDTSLFNFPQKKINNNVGKALDGKYSHYAWTSEIEIMNEVFLDITVISGIVQNGIMDIQEKHRFFLTEGFIYAADGGDTSILSSVMLHGNFKLNKFGKRYPNLYIDRYNGKYPIMYILSREYFPLFEILAKAGYSSYADDVIEEYMAYELLQAGYTNKSYRFTPPEIPNITNFNVYGKNDRQILGFKLSKLHNINFDWKEMYKNKYISYFFEDIKNICDFNPNILSEGLDDILFEFIKDMLKDTDENNRNLIIKQLSYLKSIGSCNAYWYVDYLRICKQLHLFHDGMYPKNIKHSHDVMVTYLNNLQEVEKNKAFDETVSSEEYLTNLYCPEGEDYCILAPRKANDLVKESYQLSHCVRSYIGRVASKNTKIYFMRLQDRKATPFITIELTRHNCIVQARGKGNRSITSKEFEFVKKWAIEKNLDWNFY